MVRVRPTKKTNRRLKGRERRDPGFSMQRQHVFFFFFWGEERERSGSLDLGTDGWDWSTDGDLRGVCFPFFFSF